ncbi:MAG: hypothetical protein WA081_04960 [Desulfosalsimonadaceae bacterium]
MKLRNEKAETGHLLSFVSKTDPNDNFSLFFPVEGLDQFDTLLEVTTGFEKCLETWPGIYDYRGYSISDYGEIEKAFPEIDANRVFFFEQSEFLSEASRFIEPFGKALLKRFVQKQNRIFPDIVTGAMAVGSGFYDREDAISGIWEMLRNKKNILFRAPRRFGKTSLLNHISKNPAPGWHACFVDLEGGDSAEKFVEKILTAMLAGECFDPFLPDHLAGQRIFEQTDSAQLEILRKERQKIRSDWKKYAETLFIKVENAPEDTCFLFILDEVSFLIEDMLERKGDAEKDISELLYWFHGFRNGLKKIRFILSGSEHLPTFLSVLGIEGRLDDLAKAHLGLFDEKTADEFVFLALAGQKLVASKTEMDLIRTLMGKPIPYFLHLFLDAVSRTCKEEKFLSSEKIESIYEHHLLGSDSKRYFESITRQLDRYERYGSRNTAGTKSILDRLAEAENPVEAKELKTIWQRTTGSSEHFDIMIDIMQDDFYLAKDESQNVFIDSKLIKDWWRKHGIAGSR